MPVTKPQAQMLATLACASRPVGARRWDEGGVVAAIGKVHQLHLADVALAVFRAADDRSLDTPGAIGNPSAPCWRERASDRPAPSVRSTGPWCQTCGRTQAEHRGDHEFEAPREKAPVERVVRTVEALKAEVQPMRTPKPTTHPERVPGGRAEQTKATSADRVEADVNTEPEEGGNG